MSNHRDQAGRDPSSARYRRSIPGNRRLETRNKDLKQGHQKPNSRYHKPISKKPARKYPPRNKFDDEIRGTISSKNADEEFERLIREIEGGL